MPGSRSQHRPAGDEQWSRRAEYRSPQRPPLKKPPLAGGIFNTGGSFCYSSHGNGRGLGLFSKGGLIVHTPEQLRSSLLATSVRWNSPSDRIASCRCVWHLPVEGYRSLREIFAAALGRLLIHILIRCEPLILPAEKRHAIHACGCPRAD